MVRPQAEVRPTMTSAEGWNPRRARRLVLLGLLVLWLGWCLARHKNSGITTSEREFFFRRDADRPAGR
jgi:hypothetical protein